MILLLDEPNVLDRLLWIKVLERQDGSDQQACLLYSQGRSPLFSRFWTRTRK